MKATLCLLAALLLTASGVLLAQTRVEVNQVELSVPFGTVDGKIVLVGDYLVFIDDEQSRSSFAIPRREIQDITSDAGVVVIETRQAIRDRSGDRTRFSFRLVEGTMATLTNWSRMTDETTAGTTSVADVSGSAGSDSEQRTYQARHNHRLGSCNGRLIINDEMIAYESTDRIEDSRRWQLADIKELHQPNPYEIEIDPFVGGQYRFFLEGTAMNGQEFSALVDRVTAARVAR